MPAPKSTQSFVPVEEVRNGVVVLKQDGYRGILMCSAMNFALKSADEQRAIIGGFQNFLNTLDFSVEIVVHSRKMDIRPYLALLESQSEKQQSELMRLQVREYIAFIRNFMDSTDIMTKMFYVVVPYVPAIASEVASAVPFLKKQAGATSSTADNFEEHRAQLEQRMGLVTAGLQTSGIRAVPLGTEEIIELLYRAFNPGVTENPIRLTA
jgi:hypothetical protein